MTTTIYDHILANLRRYTWMRSDRHGAIRAMLQEKYSVCNWNNVDDIARDWLSYDRVFRLVQNENKDVQVAGHEEKKVVREQSYELTTLAREVNHDRNVKQLSLIGN